MIKKRVNEKDYKISIDIISVRILACKPNKIKGKGYDKIRN